MSGGTTRGEISGNTASAGGGGVYVQSSTFNMNGGAITGNTASAGGGGVHLGADGALNMTGGEITGNELTSTYGDSTMRGAGVYVYWDATMSVKGDGAITITGNTDPQKKVTVSVEERTLGEVTSKRDGSFTITVTLRSEGEQVLAVMTDSAEAMLAVRYEMPSVPFVITAPQETVFTGEHVMVRGETEPNATVYIEGEGMNANVKANKNGAFSIRVFIDDEATRTFTLRAKAKGYKDGYQTITLTRKFTEREGIAKFRQKMQSVEYDDLAKASENYFGRKYALRGKVMEFTDYDGSPCALVCVDNPTAGSWYGPTWVILTGAEEIEVGNIATFYLTGEGLTLPASGEHTRSGEDAEAPGVRAVYVSDITEPK